MQFARLLRSSILAATIIFAGALFTNPVMADPVVIQLGSLTGTVDPITYSIPEGTFTTSTIQLTLNTSETSFFTVDSVTGVVTAHTVIDASFDDGRGNALSGTIFIDEIGMLGSDPADPILMEITNGTLVGAGLFSGTRIRGINPTFLDPIIGRIRWFWVTDRPGPTIEIELPIGFTNTTTIPTSGSAEANPIPEPTTLLLLGSGLAGIGGALRRRRRK